MNSIFKIGGAGAIIGIVIGILIFPSFNNLLTQLDDPIKADSAQKLFNEYWAYEDSRKDPKIVEQIFTKLEEDERDTITKHFKNKYRLTYLTLDEKMIKKIRKAHKKLNKPEYLKLYLGDAKPKTSQFGFIAFGYNPPKDIQKGGMGSDIPYGSDGYSDEFFYIEGDESPTCPYECDRAWAIKKPADYPY